MEKNCPVKKKPCTEMIEGVSVLSFAIKGKDGYTVVSPKLTILEYRMTPCGIRIWPTCVNCREAVKKIVKDK